MAIDVFGMSHSTSPEEVQRFRKRELRNLLTSYADEADVFAEVIQNAWDALRSAVAQGMYAGADSPRITIVIGRRAGGDPHYLLVRDNGTGMQPSVATKFTAPGFTHGKALGRSVGYKGVGASFLFAAANKVGFITKDASGATTEATVVGAYAWIMSQHEPQPQLLDALNLPDAITELRNFPRGTLVYYEFHPGLKPKNLSHLVLHEDSRDKELKNWATFLCTKTALGQVLEPGGPAVKVDLWLDDGNEIHKSEWTIGEYDRRENRLGYPYPWRVFGVHKDVADIAATPESSRTYTHQGKHQALRLRWTAADVLSASPPFDFSDAEQELVENSFEFIDVFFAYSTDVLATVHERTGARARNIRYGIRLAVDGIPQGRMMEFDLTSNAGLSRQAHALVSFKNLELDTGRKIPANETVGEVVRKITVRAMSQLADYRWAMKRKSRPEPSVDLESWRSSVTERISGSITRALFEKVGDTSPILVDPDSEQDVIALFSGLVAAKLLKGYTIAALSGFNRYDGLINIDTASSDLADHDDPLSIQDASANRGGDLRVLEFKVQFADVLTDFNEQKKRPQDIDLLVCWTLPSLNVGRGSIQYTYGDKKDHRQIYGMTHIWADENDTSSMPIISLKHLVAELLKVKEANQPSLGAANFESLLNADRDASV
ncbi:MAG: hypothetical protein B7X39_18975 [Lysobacterales bacterium 14-68-21]|nr:MAG: hypothetical protein B7X39_18975 [Xanthomonadales bacterium 14-68-21]